MTGQLAYFTQFLPSLGAQSVPPEELNLTRIVSIPFEENTFVLNLPARSDCVVIDPGLEPQKIVRHLAHKGLAPAAILVTHGHSDHIGGIGAMKEAWPDCPVVIGTRDAPKLVDPRANLSADFGFSIASPAADIQVEHGQVYSAAGVDFEVREVPGHSIGHVVYLLRAVEPAWVFVGDVIFAGSVGRTDFPDGDFRVLAEGIHRELFTLPDETLLLPGHGPTTTVGDEKRTNPFVGMSAGR